MDLQKNNGQVAQNIDDIFINVSFDLDFQDFEDLETGNNVIVFTKEYDYDNFCTDINHIVDLAGCKSLEQRKELYKWLKEIAKDISDTCKKNKFENDNHEFIINHTTSVQVEIFIND